MNYELFDRIVTVTSAFVLGVALTTLLFVVLPPKYTVTIPQTTEINSPPPDTIPFMTYQRPVIIIQGQ